MRKRREGNYGDSEGLANNALTLLLYSSTNAGISSGLPRAVFNTLVSNSSVSFWNCAQLPQSLGA